MQHKLKVVISVSNRLDTIPVFQAKLEQILEKKQVSEEAILKASLISQEILSRTISDGYPDMLGEPQLKPLSSIEVTVAVGRDRSVLLQFCDEARPFDPLSPGPQIDHPAQGWGPSLVKRLADRVMYVRRYGYNIIELCIEDLVRKGDGLT